MSHNIENMNLVRKQTENNLIVADQVLTHLTEEKIAELGGEQELTQSLKQNISGSLEGYGLSNWAKKIAAIHTKNYPEFRKEVISQIYGG